MKDMKYMTYNAEDIARVLIREYIKLGSPTTNMKLQKVLYYSWVEYYQKTKKHLFEDKIYAWKFGPVVRDVYFNYRMFAAMPITSCKEPGVNIDDDTTRFLSDFASRYKDRTAGGLVFDAHRDGSPWHEVYKDGEKNIVIPFDRIIDIECQ